MEFTKNLLPASSSDATHSRPFVRATPEDMETQAAPAVSPGPTEATFRGLCSVKIIVTWEKRDILLQPNWCGQKNLLPARNDADTGQWLITSSVSWLTLCAVICCYRDSFLLHTRVDLGAEQNLLSTQLNIPAQTHPIPIAASALNRHILVTTTYQTVPVHLAVSASH